MVTRRSMGARMAITAMFVLVLSFAALPVIGRTITVGPSGCTYTRIQPAIDAAQSGDTVSVRAGTYVEQITLKDGIVLQGAGWETTKITYGGVSATLIARNVASGRVDGFTIECTASESDSTIVVSSSEVTISNCAITGSNDGIAVATTSSPTIENNIIRDNSQFGIWVYGSATGTVRGNEIHGNGSTGIIIGGDASILVEGNVVRNNAKAGVVVYGRATGTIRNNEIYENGFGGVHIGGETNPLVEGNIIRSNTQSGIYLYDNPAGTIRDNDIFENGYAGISISDDAEPLIEDNSIRNNTDDGIWVYDSATGTIRDNEIFENGISGVGIEGVAAPLIEGNTIHSNALNGVWASDSATGTIRNNEISDNEGFGILIEDDASPVVENNTIANNTEGNISAPGTAAAPHITAIDVPTSFVLGVPCVGTISFQDVNADLARALFTGLDGSSKGFRLDLTMPPYATQVVGFEEGDFNFSFGIGEPGSHRIRVWLIDRSGLLSAPVEFSFDVAAPEPPAITRVTFPTTIAIDQDQNGLVKFEDFDGDIVQAQFEVLEGDSATIEIQPGTSFDPEVQGDTEGMFRFTVNASKVQTITLRLILIDSAGAESEPYEFTFEVQ